MCCCRQCQYCPPRSDSVSHTCDLAGHCIGRQTVLDRSAVCGDSPDPPCGQRLQRVYYIRRSLQAPSAIRRPACQKCHFNAHDSDAFSTSCARQTTSMDGSEAAAAPGAPPLALSALSTPARSEALEPAQPASASPTHGHAAFSSAASSAELEVRRSIDDNAATILRRFPVVVSALPALQGA